MVAQAFNTNTQEAKAGEYLWVQDQPGLEKESQGPQRETQPQNKQKPKTEHSLLMFTYNSIRGDPKLLASLELAHMSDRQDTYVN